MTNNGFDVVEQHETQGLTYDDFSKLRAPFQASEVEFLRNFAYVREQAVNFRLSKIDPSWQYVITHMEYRSVAHVVVIGYMTVKGVTRYAIGEQKNEGNPVRELDCAKGAETDLLKRLARKFMVGLYLTELPDNVRDDASYKAWLAAQKAS